MRRTVKVLGNGLGCVTALWMLTVNAMAQDMSDWPELPPLDPHRVAECWAIYTDEDEVRRRGPEADACSAEIYPCTPPYGPEQATPPVTLDREAESTAIACYRANTERLRRTALAMLPQILPEPTEEARVSAVLNLMRMVRDHAANCANDRDPRGADARACDQFIWVEIIAGGTAKLPSVQQP